MTFLASVTILYPMLQIDPAPSKTYPRLHLQGVRATAWIEHRSWHLRGVDWQLWIERKGRMTSAKCPLRLEIESRLRSWLLRVSGMPLHTLTYTQLRLITEGKIAEARRLHIRDHDTLMHRPVTSPTPVSGFIARMRWEEEHVKESLRQAKAGKFATEAQVEAAYEGYRTGS